MARRIASPTALGSTRVFSFIALGGVGSAAYDSTRYWPPAVASSISLIDEVVMSNPSNGRYLRENRNTFSFRFSKLRSFLGSYVGLCRQYITGYCQIRRKTSNLFL